MNGVNIVTQNADTLCERFFVETNLQPKTYHAIFYQNNHEPNIYYTNRTLLN